MNRNYNVITFFQKTFILRRPGAAIFAGIIKILTMFIKNFFKDSRKLEGLEIINLDRIYISIS